MDALVGCSMYSFFKIFSFFLTLLASPHVVLLGIKNVEIKKNTQTVLAHIVSYYTYNTETVIYGRLCLRHVCLC